MPRPFGFLKPEGSFFAPRMLGAAPALNRSNGRHKISVMLVDDETTFLRIETLFLETHYRNEVNVVGTANTGEECLAKAQLLAPELILIDLNMPGLSGLQTIPLLRIMFPETRIIALTLNDGENSRRAVLAAGGNELVSKATMSTDLMPAIRRVMRQDQLTLQFAGV
ncbi:MAG: response regulator transcription factor [Chloroflexi bacterium]|nr:response regulator transcription factor [Chloroflexota bacterium]